MARSSRPREQIQRSRAAWVAREIMRAGEQCINSDDADCRREQPAAEPPFPSAWCLWFHTCSVRRGEDFVQTAERGSVLACSPTASSRRRKITMTTSGFVMQWVLPFTRLPRLSLIRVHGMIGSALSPQSPPSRQMTGNPPGVTSASGTHSGHSQLRRNCSMCSRTRSPRCGLRTRRGAACSTPWLPSDARRACWAR